MWQLFLSTERSVLIVTNKSTCSGILGSQALHHSYSCSLDLSTFLELCQLWLQALPQFLPGRCCFCVPGFLGFLPRSLLMQPFVQCCWLCRSDAGGPQVAECAENICWASRDQPNSSGSGNSVHLGWSWAAAWNQGGRPRKFSPCWCLRALCRGWLLCGVWCFQVSNQCAEAGADFHQEILMLFTWCWALCSPFWPHWELECGIWGNQAECSPEDSLGILLQTCV